jgi:predicted AlkP superfamily pyrophosphatase or phosphodiesterase
MTRKKQFDRLRDRIFRSLRGWAGCAGVVLAGVAAWGGGARGAGAAPAGVDTNHVVVMISVDGLAAFYFDDPKAEMPTIHALAAAGAHASMMKCVTPTVTWPNHTTLVTGVAPARHGVVGNNYLDRATGQRVVLISDPVFDKEAIVKVPTIYDLAKAAGLKTAAVRWPASRNAPTLDWTIPDVGTAELAQRYTTPSLLAEASAAGIPILGKHGHTRLRDDICTPVFNLILRQHHPQLALLHLLDVDHAQHLSGPRSPEAYATIKKADGQVRAVWEELKRDFPGRATLFVVADHGFSPIKRVILPNVVLRKAGLVSVRGGKVSGGAVRTITQGGALMVYITDEARQAEVAGRVRQAIQGLTGVADIIGPDQLAAYGVADPKQDPHAPDMILFAEEGFTFGDTAAGDLPFSDKPERKGSHGHNPALPHLHAIFVAWGDGIKPGVELGEISNLSVAPTIATLLGLTIPNAEGKPLEAVLASGSKEE